MESLIRSLLAAVRKETSILDSLVQLGYEKKQLIIRNQFRELDTLVQKEGIVVSGLQRAEDARFKLQGELAQTWDILPEDLTATVLTTRLQMEEFSAASDAEQALLELNKAAKQLQSINKDNQELTNYALDYLDYLLTMMQGDVAGIYSENGREAEERSFRPARQLLDRIV
ncbi:MAG TPA: flagellar protein FlgN [Syntrophomonadaceae bacterium]|nr:flagellar protein FlgN [Syntrophomonadaceae bacterium]